MVQSECGFIEHSLVVEDVRGKKSVEVKFPQNPLSRNRANYSSMTEMKKKKFINRERINSKYKI